MATGDIVPHVYDAFAEMRRSFARYQAEVTEYNLAAQTGDRKAMDMSRGLLHAYIDEWLDALAKAMRQQAG